MARRTATPIKEEERSIKWKRGARVRNKPNPLEAFDELQRIKKRLGAETILPEDVVEASKSKRSLLHDCFTWDNEQAAHEHRLWEARSLINSLECEVIYADPNAEENKRRVRVQALVVEKIGEGYTEVTEVLKDPERSTPFLSKAWEELESWRKKYQAFGEFAEVVTAIEEASRRRRESVRMRRTRTPSR